MTALSLGEMRRCSGANAAGCRGSFAGQRVGSRPFVSGRALERVAALEPRQGRGTRIITEANLFGRFVRVVKSYANTIVTGLEDPEKVLDQAVNDMQEDLIKMRQASAQVMASQKQLEKKYQQAKDTADEWYRRAQMALEKGDEELAREALKRRKGYQESAQQLSQQLEAQRKATDQLIANTRMLEGKLAEAKSKKDTLKARAASAKTSKQINEIVGQLNTSNSVVAFEKMEEKVLAMESEAEAANLLVAPDTIEKRFRELEGDSVEDDLQALKRLSARGPSGALPEGRPLRDAIDVELEDMKRRSR